MKCPLCSNPLARSLNWNDALRSMPAAEKARALRESAVQKTATAEPIAPPGRWIGPPDGDGASVVADPRAEGEP